MALVTPIHLAHTPASITVYASLFKDTTNASFLREQLLAGNTDYEYAFIDASTIFSATHILAAVFRAINDLVNARLRSRNVHSEVVFSLSMNNNITTSFTNFGLSPTTTSLLALKISHTDSPTNLSNVTDFLSTKIQGTPLPFNDIEIEALTDMDRVKKIYKLNMTPASADRKKQMKGQVDVAPRVGMNGTEEGREDRKEMEVMVLGMMALKGS